MIKWPEPVANIEAHVVGTAKRYKVTALEHIEIGEHAVYTEAQLKQAVRDALSLAADTCESTLYVEGDGAVSVFGPKTDANVEIRKCRDAIRALIKEI